MPSLEWPETTWEKITVRWYEFLNNYLARTSRYDVPGGDLMPDRFTRLEEHLKSEMEDETKDSIDIQASVEAEAGFLGIRPSVQRREEVAASSAPCSRVRTEGRSEAPAANHPLPISACGP